MRERVVSDVSDLPTTAFSTRSITWWGTAGFVLLEATGFALAAGVYLYLASRAPQWPLTAAQPDLLPGTLVTLVLLASVVPNYLTKIWGERMDLPRVRLGMVIMSAAGILPLVIRVFEFPALNVWWDSNAYGSILRVLLGLHTTHLLTDVVDTIVLTVLMFTRHAHNGRRFSDVTDNAFYWNFVVISWLPIYFLIYWFPRLWGWS
jgi:cytochrome c oxidase subunit III